MDESDVWTVLRPGIRRTLLVFSLLLVIIPALFFMIVGGISSYQSLMRKAREQIAAATSLKQREIERWVEEREGDLAILATEATLQQFMETLRDHPEDSSPYRAAYSEISVRLIGFLRKKVAFADFSILDHETGRTIVSTSVVREGQIHLSGTCFQEAQRGQSCLQVINADPVLNESTLLIARPIAKLNGELLGVLIGRANLADLNVLLRARAGLGKTGETYLVDAEGFYLIGSQNAHTAPIGVINSAGIHAAVSGAGGLSQYYNYRGERVFGAYHWLPNLKMALIVEQQWSETIADALRQVLLMSGVTIGAVILALGIALRITRRIVTPIAELTQVTTEIAAGDLQRVAPVGGADEIGRLARSFNSMTAQLRDLITNLEQRVAARTRDLERRSNQLEVSAHVARDAAAIHDVQQLLDATVKLVSEQFGFYHTGIFLVDEKGEYAVLHAASSEGGQRMLARKHKLKVGQTGIVGYVAGAGQPRIALDVGEDSVFFNNPDLPHTHSEMALPLKVRERIIGALDVQSTKPEAFSAEDIAVLQTLADQIALAITNARLFQEIQRDKQFQEALIYNSPVAVAVTDLEDRIVSWNPAAEKLFGYSLNEVLGCSLDDTVTGPAEHLEATAYTRRMHEGYSIHSFTQRRRQDGILVEVELLGVPVLVNGEQVASFVIYHDLTEIKQTEQALRESEQKLEHAYHQELKRRRQSDTLREVAKIVSGTLEQQKVLNLILDQLELVITYHRATVMLLKERQLILVAGRDRLEGRLKRFTIGAYEYPLNAVVLHEKTPILLPDVTQDERWRDMENIGMRMMHSFINAPLLVKDKPIGILSIGRRDQTAYTVEDAQTTFAFANQVAVALEQARLHEYELAQIERELSIARQLQTSLLPADAPVMLGLDIAGFSQPAREVGGDFYNYFVFAEGCLGITVGDVSGKGIQAALMMALSLGVLTTEIQREIAPGMLLTTLNMELCPHTLRNGMNTALGYVILEQFGGNWILHAANAGLISPLVCHRDRTAEWLDVTGLPLGMIDDTRYEELRCTLTSGDMLLLSSDGIVEAMNIRGELYGFERLEVCVASAPRNSAQQMLEWIIADVRGFVGSAEQHDDLTVVVIRVEC